MFPAMPFSRYVFGTLPWYSVLIVTGILLAYLIGAREEKRLGLPRDTMLDVTLVSVPCGIVGARIYYVLLSLEQFRQNPISVFYIWEGGIAIYGAVIGGLLGLLIYARRKKLSPWTLMDMVAPGLLLAQAIGRWGNYFNMEAYGPAITQPQLQWFPFGVLIAQGETVVWHMATFFYESLWNLAGFGVLMLIRKRMKRKGDLFLWYLALYGSGRYMIEQLRMDSLYLGSIRFSQYLSLLLCLVAAVVYLVRVRGDKRWKGFGACVLLVAFGRFALRDFSWQWAFVLLGAVATAVLCWPEKGRYWLLGALLAADLALSFFLPKAEMLSVSHALYSLYLSLTLPLYIMCVYMGPFVQKGETTCRLEH